MIIHVTLHKKRGEKRLQEFTRGSHGTWSKPYPLGPVRHPVQGDQAPGCCGVAPEGQVCRTVSDIFSHSL